MKIKANIVILTVDYQRGKTYVLSKSDRDISIPYFEVNNSNKLNLGEDVKNSIMNYLPKANELEITEQIITHHNGLLDTDEDEMNMIFGYLLSFTPCSENIFWIELDWRKAHKLHEVLFQVVQRLK